MYEKQEHLLLRLFSLVYTLSYYAVLGRIMFISTIFLQSALRCSAFVCETLFSSVLVRKTTITVYIIKFNMLKPRTLLQVSTTGNMEIIFFLLASCFIHDEKAGQKPETAHRDPISMPRQPPNQHHSHRSPASR